MAFWQLPCPRAKFRRLSQLIGQFRVLYDPVLGPLNPKKWENPEISNGPKPLKGVE
jgi:hypothetical protein